MKSKKTRAVAGSLYERYGAHLTWPARFAIVIPIDIADIIVDALFFWIPLVHIVVNGIQIFVGWALLGPAGGLLQVLEFTLGFAPWTGALIGAFPLLTAACFVCYVAEQWKNAETERERRGVMWTIGSGVIGGVLGLVLWKNGFIGFWSIFLVGAGGILMRFALPSARTLPFSWRWTAGAGGGIIVALLALCQINLWVISDPEGFRDDAWTALIVDKDPRIAAAKKADRIGDAIDASGILQTADKIIRESRTALAGHITGKSKGKQDPTTQRPKIVDRKNEPAGGADRSSADDSTIGSRALAFVAENIIKPAELESVTGKKADEITPEMFQVMERLKLGKIAAKVYMFDFVLERAEKIREDKIAWLKALSVWLLLGIGLVASVSIAQYAQEKETIAPDEKPDLF